MISKDFIAVDTGGNGALRAHREGGPVDIPGVVELRKMFRDTALEYRREVGAVRDVTTPSEKKLLSVRYLLTKSDVVMESATVGSHGFKTETLRRVIRESSHRLYVCSGHLVKNHLKDRGGGLTTSDISDEDAAEIIFKAIKIRPGRAKLFKEDPAPPFKHKSVRPMDEHNYDCREARMFMHRLEGYDAGEPGVTMSPSQVIPFAMSMDEYFAQDDRNRWSGAFATEHRYPSFYSRAYIDLCDDISKEKFQVSKKENLSREQRKYGQRSAQRELRRMFDHMKLRMGVPFVDEEPPVQDALFSEGQLGYGL